MNTTSLRNILMSVPLVLVVSMTMTSCGGLLANNPITTVNLDNNSVEVRSLAKCSRKGCPKGFAATYRYRPGLLLTVRIPDGEMINQFDKHEVFVVGDQRIVELVIPAEEDESSPIKLIFWGCPPKKTETSKGQ